jgi:hypothetical protein
MMPKVHLLLVVLEHHIDVVYSQFRIVGFRLISKGLLKMFMFAVRYTPSSAGVRSCNCAPRVELNLMHIQSSGIN